MSNTMDLIPSTQNNSMDDLKKRAASLLFDSLISGLEKGEMTVEDSKKSARKIEMHIDQLESSEELLVFLRSLDQKYPTDRKSVV